MPIYTVSFYAQRPVLYHGQVRLGFRWSRQTNLPKATMPYVPGHNKTVLKGHAHRTVEDSAAYLLPHLKSSDHILDVGCGPGTITLGLARRVPEGKVTGLDTSEDLARQGRENAKAEGLENVDFVVGDAFHLDYPDDTFDVTHCHQVLFHLEEPLAVLKEMKRVTRSGGTIACREAIIGAGAVFPQPPPLERFFSSLHHMHTSLKQHPQAGMMLRHWAIQLGIPEENLLCSATPMCHTGKEEREWFGDVFSARCAGEEYMKNFTGTGAATRDEMLQMSEAWKMWAQEPGAWVVIPNGEIIMRVP